jgi:NADH-quinone oxidoreductase subunit L
MALYEYSWLILLSPLFAFAVIIFGTRMGIVLRRQREADGTSHDDDHAVEPHSSEGEIHGERSENNVEELLKKVSGYVGIVILALACVYSWVLLLNTAGVISITQPLPSQGISITQISYGWCQNIVPNNCLGLGSYVIAFHLDNLAIAMMVVVTTVSLLVQFYSQGYMEDEHPASYARFFSYLSLFAFSMLMIVFAENFLVIFVGWELVGLSSYLLIGFWFNNGPKPAEDRLSPATASLEAFIANRVGDVGFIIGIMILFVNTGTFTFSQLPAAVMHMDKTLLTVAMILVFCGAIGKSAQVPLHVWLPPAMEGPTPVSALIHAATMVAAGVYMVSRTFLLFAAADPAAFQVVAWIGGITAIFAATIALTQTDFKRVLAFSTISQLGYMFVGLGVAGTELGPGPGMFHLFTHAFFKALLFLGAGSVLHALHHATHREVQDMRLMGGLASRMPVTAITWLIATLSIGGFPFFAGFFSKDTIIGLSYDHGYYALYAITLVTAGLTAFYMLRAYILAFGGKGGKWGGLWGNDEIYRGEGVPHESPATITIPLILLAIPSVIAGYWFGFFSYVQPGAPDLTFTAIVFDLKTWIGVAVSLVGFTWAYILYTRFELARVNDYVQNRAVLRVAHRILLRKYYVDELYNLLIRYVVLGISHIEQAFDTYIIDGLVNGTARLVTTIGRDVRHVETGRVQAYMIGFFGGIAVLAILVFALVTFVK